MWGKRNACFAYYILIECVARDRERERTHNRIYLHVSMLQQGVVFVVVGSEFFFLSVDHLHLDGNLILWWATMFSCWSFFWMFAKMLFVSVVKERGEYQSIKYFLALGHWDRCDIEFGVASHCIYEKKQLKKCDTQTM